LLTGFIAGFILGYLLSMPPIGPTNFAIIAKGFKKEIKPGVAIGAGAGFMDLFYILIAFGGVSALYSFLPATAKDFLIDKEDYFKLGISIFGCFIVIFYGFKIMKMKAINEKDDEPIEDEIEKIEDIAEGELQKTEKEIAKIIKKKPAPQIKSNLTANFFTGVLLCLSSVTLPASWIAIVSFLKGYGVIESNIFSGFAFAVGVMLGTIAWFYTLVKVISAKAHKITPSALNKLNISVGIILISLGIFLLYEVFVFACSIIKS
jgi:arginine exporter protein ArgO